MLKRKSSRFPLAKGATRTPATCIQVNSAFTLVELLVVIAIIGILAAIIFPVYLGSKAKGRQAKCMNNLRQIGVATQLYMGETGGKYAPWMADESHKPYGTWFIALKKYSKTELLANCPADGSKPGDAGAAPGPHGKPVSYWKNAYTDYWCGRAGLNPTIGPPTEADIIYPKSTCYLMDGPIAKQEGYTWWGPPRTYPWNDEDTLKAAKDAETRHSGGANVLFCDWHVKLVHPNDWKTTNTGSASDNPLRRLPYHPEITPPWDEKNDGTNPWFRGD